MRKRKMNEKERNIVRRKNENKKNKKKETEKELQLLDEYYVVY